MTPFSTLTELVGDHVRVSVLMTTDAGPAREFRPYLDVDLDETHALILFAELGLALQALDELRARPVGSNVLPIR